MQDFQDRPGGGRPQQQPSFSAYRPEAYASEKRAQRPADRQEWPPEAPRSAPERQQHHDPYHNADVDPYDAGRQEFDANWRPASSYQEPPANQFAAASYFQPQHDEPPAHDAQSMHDRFFAADPEPEPAPPPVREPAPAAPRYRQQPPQDDFDDGFQVEERPAPRAAPAPAPSRGGFDNDETDYRWDNFDQQPAPEAVRPFPTAKMGAAPAPDEDLDADYFADEEEEEEFDGEDDYAEPKSGSKKLMAAVLVGAVVTGGGLAYLYKAKLGGNENGEPALVTADVRPVKEQPADPGGRQFANGGKLIYERLPGAGGGDEPTRVAAREESTSADIPGTVTTNGTGTLEERIENARQNGRDASANTAASLDTPRPVKTELIRPDGSVDSRVQRRAAPAESDAPAARAPAAAPRQQQLAVAPPAATAAAVPTTGGDGMFVQIAARNDEAAAKAAFVDLKQKYASVLGDYAPSVRKVDLGEKGVWFRLLVGPMPSKADADKLCEDLKTAGMKGCFSRKAGE